MNTLFAQSNSGGGGSLLGFILPILIIFVVMYLFLILPQQRKQKKHRQMVESLKKGDKVITSGGIYGVVTRAGEHTLKIKVAEKTEIEVDKSAIIAKVG